MTNLILFTHKEGEGILSLAQQKIVEHSKWSIFFPKAYAYPEERLAASAYLHGFTQQTAQIELLQKMYVATDTRTSFEAFLRDRCDPCADVQSVKFWLANPVPLLWVEKEFGMSDLRLRDSSAVLLAVSADRYFIGSQDVDDRWKWRKLLPYLVDKAGWPMFEAIMYSWKGELLSIDCALRVRGNECFFIPEDVALGYEDIIKEGERLFQWRKWRVSARKRR